MFIVSSSLRTSLVTSTTSFWPMRTARPTAWSMRAAVHHGLINTILVKCCRLRPTPPLCSCSNKTSCLFVPRQGSISLVAASTFSFIASGTPPWYCCTRAIAGLACRKSCSKSISSRNWQKTIHFVFCTVFSIILSSALNLVLPPVYSRAYPRGSFLRAFTYTAG